MIAAMGAVVLAIDAPFARRSGAQVYFSPRDSAEHVQLIVDLQHGLDFLLSQPGVDPGRLAYRGWSYGGAVGALFIAVERRLKTAILTVPDGGLVAHFAGEGMQGPLQSLPCADQQRWVRAMLPIEPVRFVHLSAPTSILVQRGRFDTIVPPSAVMALANAASEPKTLKWYDAGHGLTPAAIDDQLQWLSEHVGTGRR